MTIDERLAAAGLPPLPRRAWLEIDEDALRSNVAVFRELIGPNVELMAVVKADAYGHGLVPTARAFVAAGADRLCVASVDERAALLAGGVQSDVLVLYRMPGEVTAEVEVETGLTRGGFKPDELAAHTPPEALWSHLASPEDADATVRQVSEFERAVDAIGSRSGWPRRHLAATGGVLSGRGPSYEGVRIGIGLYGLYPSNLPIPDNIRLFAERLRPAMALKCMPLRVATFPAGTAVGYGGTWVAQRESVVATLPVGYGDGFARAYQPGGQALVRGRRVPLVGTVAMDAVMADVTEIEGVTTDDEFVLLGDQGDESITANELARLRNTIPWEVVTGMSFRLPRVYHAASVLKGLRTLAGEVRASGE
jgi:alanine racemase